MASSLPPHLTREDRLYWELLDELDRSGSVVRATIVRTWGSTPREVGAKMLVTPTGAIRGTVGGGCGEAEVWQEAKAVLARGGWTQVHVDLTDDPDSDEGKVCGGRFDVFLERWEKGSPAAVTLREALSLAQDKVLATYLGPAVQPHWKKTPSRPVGEGWPGVTPGSQFLVDCDHPSAELPPELVTAARDAWRKSRSQTQIVPLEGPQAFFFDVLGRPADLVIAGAGHIARPLCEMAAICGYRVTVVDDRSEYADPINFPRAEQVLCQDFGEAFQAYPWGSQSHAVLVTRGHKHDEECLRRLIGKDLAYVGMIGSRRRTRAVLDDLAGEGIEAAWLSRVHAPIGLDIGAETPEEISVCILAEMIKVRRGGRAASMRKD